MGIPERVRTVVFCLNKWYVCTFYYHFVFNSLNLASNIQIDNIPFFNFFSLKILHMSIFPKIVMNAESFGVCSKYPVTLIIQTLIVSESRRQVLDSSRSALFQFPAYINGSCSHIINGLHRHLLREESITCSWDSIKLTTTAKISIQLDANGYELLYIMN